MITHESIYPPVIVTIASGTYICPGWRRVPDNTTVSDIIWNPPARVNRPLLEAVIASSDGKSQYTVTNHNDIWSCSCTGFKYHKRCKHIDHVKQTKVSDR